MSKLLVEKISLTQLFMLVLLFEIGSAIVVGVGKDAGRDAWIAVLVAGSFGLLLFALFYFVVRESPKQHLFELIEKAFGRWLALPITFVYVVYFVYLASRVLRDFAELLKTVIFPSTPMEIIALLFMLTVSYVIYLGVEVLARSSEIFMPYFILFVVLISVFLLISKDVDFQRLAPVTAEGWGPILQSVFPTVLTFPFGEILVFTTLLGFVGPKSVPFRRIGITAAAALGLSILLLAYHTALVLSVLGPDMRERSTFPLLSAVREISVANFIERLDALVVFIMMLGIFVKVGLYFFGALKGVEYMTRIPYRYFTLPVGILISIFSILSASNFAEHLEEGLDFVPAALHLPLQMGFPLVLLAGLRLARLRKGGNTTHEST